MRLVTLYAALAALAPSAAWAASDGRYQMVAIPDASGGIGSEKVIILDTQSGHLWTWTEVAATDGGAGGRFLIYQGQVRPGSRIGEVIEQQEWQPDPPPAADADDKAARRR